MRTGISIVAIAALILLANNHFSDVAESKTEATKSYYLRFQQTPNDCPSRVASHALLEAC